MTTQPLLEIHLHLVNGETHRFLQNDPELAHKVVEQVNLKVFTQPSLVIAGQDRVWAYPGAALAGISLITESGQQELLRLSPFPIVPREIAESDYQAGQPDAHSAEGPSLGVLAEIEFTSGQRVRLEIQAPQAVSGMQERHILHTLFTGPGLLCRRLGGGISIWNRAQMISFSIVSKLEVPSNAWFAEPLDA